MVFLSNIGLSLPGFGTFLSLPTKYSAAKSESIYMHEFATFSKCLSTSGLEPRASTSFRREVREKQYLSQQSNAALKP